jgi:hypothetical protein
VIVTRKNGDAVVGRIANLNDDTLMIMEDMTAPNDFTNVRRRDIVKLEPSKVSPMPEGLLNTLKEDEILDLMAFLLSRGDRNDKIFK